MGGTLEDQERAGAVQSGAGDLRPLTWKFTGQQKRLVTFEDPARGMLLPFTAGFTN
ncbi:hypothetical protein CO2235_MP120021 [Cupriavidus oxalaticus]|uniref:Uncharacterized protein n=1 Tax=Cupriavidus oxalaticus TaxID=96344 RepID=A0A375GH06_9BURK|nr:hypothetical protein CO2235_MP120021 [Cupriavidus oxalaticus]